MNMRNILIVGLCLLFFSPPDTAASSPMCVDNALNSEEWVRKYFELSEAVFLGVVMSVDSPQFDSPPSAKNKDAKPVIMKAPAASTMDDLLKSIQAGQTAAAEERYTRVASFDILKSWKEAVLPVVRTKSTYVPGQSGFLFKVGQSYLVFAHNYDGAFYAIETTCGNTLPTTDAEERIEILNNLTSSQ